MSQVVNATRLYENISLDEVKLMFPGQTWNKIPSVDVEAFASDKGLIFKNYYNYTWGKTKMMSNSVLYNCNNNLNIYTRIYLKGGKSNKAHRYIISAFFGESSLEVNHKDCNKGNNNISNLEYMTRRDNAIHAVKNNRFPKHLNLSEEEKIKRGNRLREVNRLMKLGIIKRNINHVRWSEARKLKYKEYLKTRPRDSRGRFIKGVVSNENQL